MKCLSLNGTDWVFKAFIGEDWLWRNAHKMQTKDFNHWHTASVPGSVQNDLLKNNLVVDPLIGLNSLQNEWVPARTWVYRKIFKVPAEFADHKAQLCFAGVDYHARFYLNGEFLGEHTGMYSPVNFKVGDQLLANESNLLAVVISPAPFEQPQVGYTSRVRTHKSRMTYWWDFCPRMIHQGIWQDVTLHFYKSAVIDDLFVQPRLNTDYSAANLDFSMVCFSSDSFNAQVTVTVTHNQEVVLKTDLTQEISEGRQEFQWQCDLNHPNLWHPNGNGDQPNYSVKVELFKDEVQCCDSIVKAFGVREIHFVPNERADPDALPYTLVVNGIKTYLRGWNWVPLDAMYGVARPEKLRHLLRLAKEANVNLLRVWGGGLIETESFYDLCDQLGIMVWQEFIQSSSGIENSPPDDPDFLEFMREEASQVVPQKRNHPSLIVWCGGNELSGLETVPSKDSAPLLASLKQIVKELDPDRAWFPTSPSGRHFSFDLRKEPEVDPNQNHDVHGPWEYQGLEEHYTLYNSGGDSLFHSEFGVEGITNLRTLDHTIPTENQFPISLANLFWEHRGSWWLKETNWKTIFGNWTSVAMAVDATQYLQAEGLRYAVEADRRRQFHNSGSLPWQFNEPFPMAACTSAVDYFGTPKPAYFAVKQAYDPLHLNAQYSRLNYPGIEIFQAQIFISNSGKTVSGELTVSLRDFHGAVHALQTVHCDCPSNGSKKLLDFNASLVELKTDLFFLEMSICSTDGDKNTHSRILYTKDENLRGLFAQASTALKVERVRNLLYLTNTGSNVALSIRLASTGELEGQRWDHFEDNYFHLFPGESKTVGVINTSPEVGETQISIKGWNTQEFKV